MMHVKVQIQKAGKREHIVTSISSEVHPTTWMCMTTRGLRPDAEIIAEHLSQLTESLPDIMSGNLGKGQGTHR